MWLSLFTFTGEDITSMLAYIGEVFTDVKPLVFVVLGILIALWVFNAIIRAITKREED
ncbi:unnamed protein product [marine sediment metagenome]|uniref:Uncharacterized protein n=1 Tax=marine sediment metagenome TaxID=412755 RepID=X1JWC8_9ZZZZ